MRPLRKQENRSQGWFGTGPPPTQPCWGAHHCEGWRRLWGGSTHSISLPFWSRRCQRGCSALARSRQCQASSRPGGMRSGCSRHPPPGPQGQGQRPGLGQMKDGTRGRGGHLPIHAVLHAVADLVLGLEEEVLEGRWGNPAHAQLILQAPDTAHMYIRWGISGHCRVGRGEAGLSLGLLGPGWPVWVQIPEHVA